MTPWKAKADAAHYAVFLRPSHGNTLYGRAVRAAIWLAGFFAPVVSTRTVPPTLIDTRARINYRSKEVIAMTNHAPIASNRDASRYRAQALRALHADSSLSVRLKRYNRAITKARAIEAATPGAPIPPTNIRSIRPTRRPAVQIINRGNMWHILQNGHIRAFAATYAAAQRKADLLAGGAV